MKDNKIQKECKEEVKNRIISVASSLFHKKGIKRVTMDEIASSTMVSKRTIYELFKDKEELLLEIVRLHETYTCRLLEKISDDSTDVLDVFFYMYNHITSEFKKTNPLFILEIKKYPKVVEYLKSTKKITAKITMNGFEKGVKQGLFRDDTNFDIIRLIMIEESNFIVGSNLYKKYSLQKIHENIFFMHLRGIATNAGLKKIEQFYNDLKNKENKK